MGVQTAVTILTITLRKYFDHSRNLSASDRSFTGTCTSSRADMIKLRSYAISVTYFESEREASLISLAILVVSESSYFKLH